MTLVKICGITNLEDALAAVNAGADMLGFNFYRPSPRYVEPEAARLIIEQVPREVVSVGVFVDHPPAEVERIAGETGLQLLQLHGDESPEYCAALKAKGYQVMKVFNCGETFNANVVGDYDVDLVMLDAAAGGIRGGTGQLGDWSQARQASETFPQVFLAGGLSPENVSAAIEAVAPFGVDVCSSLELGPGKKDHARVEAFIAAVRAA
ncbi:MAG TPA: phosphoribosylanthranilate isomerase [Pyrinomonadaceae bacterium]|jgi:phosphoribosylanthranilate isomerase